MSYFQKHPQIECFRFVFKTVKYFVANCYEIICRDNSLN